MGIQRALTLYPRNDTTLYTGTGVDVRLLSDTQSGSLDVTQTCVADNTQDNVERTFDPATAGVTTVADARTLQNKGWALRLTDDMTPGDDTNCDVRIPAQTVAVSVDVALAWTGTPLAQSNPTWRCVLWGYNPVALTAGVIGSFAGVGPGWAILTDNGVFKTVTFNISAAATTFPQGTILLAQFGLNTGTLGNPAIGTSTYTFTLRVDSVNTKLTLASSLIQTCSLSSSLVGDGVTTRNGLATAMSDDLVGAGVLTESRGVVAAKSFDLVGDGVLSRQLAVAETKNMTGDGTVTESRGVVASKTFDLVGDGTITPGSLDIGVPRDLVGDGVLDVAKTVVASKTFDLVGEGTITELHPVQAFRTFNLVGDGTISGSADIPFPNIPTGDCPSDWTPNDGLKAIAGTVLFHEPPNQGNPVSGATVLLIRDSDGLLVATTLTDALGAYSFPRDTNDPYTYHVEVRWTDGGTPQQGLSEGGCAPS